MADGEKRAKLSWDDRITRAKRIWGMIFRTLFIASVGFVGYNWINPNLSPIGVIPFAQLTLNEILKPILAFGIVAACAAWFFSFPKRTVTDPDDDNPYIEWAKGSGYLLAIALVVWAYCTFRSK